MSPVARPWWGALVAAGVVLGESERADAQERGPYVHLLGGVSVGSSLRFNNPFRLEQPLGETSESVSLAAAYLDVAGAALLGLPWGAQHGLWLHGSWALQGIDQSVMAPTYVFLWRFERGRALLGRVGPSIVLGPDVNVGGELAVGGIYPLTGAIGLTAELLGTGYYGASTREVSATFVPLLSLQVGLVLDAEVLP